MFYCPLLTFLVLRKVTFLQINHPGPLSECQQFGSRSRRYSVGLHLGSNCLQKTNWQATQFVAGMHAKSYNRFSILSHIGNIHVCIVRFFLKVCSFLICNSILLV